MRCAFFVTIQTHTHVLDSEIFTWIIINKLSKDLFLKEWNVYLYMRVKSFYYFLYTFVRLCIQTYNIYCLMYQWLFLHKNHFKSSWFAFIYQKLWKNIVHNVLPKIFGCTCTHIRIKNNNKTRSGCIRSIAEPSTIFICVLYVCSYIFVNISAL